MTTASQQVPNFANLITVKLAHALERNPAMTFPIVATAFDSFGSTLVVRWTSLDAGGAKVVAQEPYKATDWMAPIVIAFVDSAGEAVTVVEEPDVDNQSN